MRSERIIAEAPVTLVVTDHETEATTFLVERNAVTTVEEGLQRIWYDTGYDMRQLTLGSIDLDVWGRLEGTLTSGDKIIVRHTVEDDAVAAQLFTEKIPLPIPVIAAYLGGMNVGTTLEALVADDGYVWTLMLTTDVGAYLRYSAAWHMLTDAESIDGLNPVEVRDTAVDMFDQADQAGNVIQVTSMPVLDEIDRYRPEEDETTAEPVTPEVNLVGSATTPLPTIETEEDVAAAIKVADDNPQHRWYVERRLAALDLPYAVPWSTRTRNWEETVIMEDLSSDN